VLGTAAARPSPITFFDACIHMGPAVVARGTPEAVGYYEALLAELRERAGAGLVEGERARVYWEGMPVWGRLRALSTLFARGRACVVASTYCNSWIFEALDPSKPFESMARAYLDLFIVRSDDIKERYIELMIAFYGIDGVVFHDAKTCPNNSNDRYGMHERLWQRLGVPCIVIHGDLNDLRLYNEEQTVTQVEAFLETIEDSRR
jgi:benzoyl-CoA reductase/2-hydroxyglutaryl-CoA dehydratase subunit BcrC/BadD/HgdB